MKTVIVSFAEMVRFIRGDLEGSMIMMRELGGEERKK